MAKGPPGVAIFDAIGIDCISELRERDRQRARGAIRVGLAAQESADLVGPERGGRRSPFGADD